MAVHVRGEAGMFHISARTDNCGDQEGGVSAADKAQGNGAPFDKSPPVEAQGIGGLIGQCISVGAQAIGGLIEQSLSVKA